MTARLMALILLIGCATSPSQPPSGTLSEFRLRPGNGLPSDASPVGVVHRGTMCIHGVTDRGIRFSIDVECASGFIAGLETHDPRFRTAERLSVSSTLRQAVAAGGTLVEEDARCEVRLPSGWIAVRHLRSDPGCSSVLDAAVESFEAPYIRREP